MDIKNKLEKKELTIGILGGMGTYATIHMFQQYAEIFNAKKEWDRPRIIIDNRCTMPSRVRAFLYNENVEQLVHEMTESMQNMSSFGCNKIILACNTSHLFLPKIYEKVPELESKVFNIVENCVNAIERDGVKEVYLLGSEGTIESKIYQNILEDKGIKCIVPEQQEYFLIRKCIEAVKQNDYAIEIENIFLKLLGSHKACILGCTELPILYSKYYDNVECEKVYDPIYLALSKLKREYYND